MTNTDLLTILPAFIVAGWAALLLLADMVVSEERQHLLGWLALIGLAVGALALLLTPPVGAGFNGMVVADSFSTYAGLIFILSGALAILIAQSYLTRIGYQHSEFYILTLFSVSGMMLMAQVGNLITLFLALELFSVPLYVMCALARDRLQSEESALKYFLLGVFSTGFLVYGIALTYGATGTTDLNGIMLAVQSGRTVAGTPLATSLLGAGAALVLVGLGFKVAAVPFHMWIPDVYEGAPSIVTAFMSVGTKVAGFVALLRVFGTAYPELATQWSLAFAVLAALTMIVGNVAAVSQSNIKRLLAYSSIAHAGYLLMTFTAFGTAAGRDTAMSNALFYLLSYAITNLGAWAVVMAVEQADGRGLQLNDYAGLAARRPGLALAMAIFMLSLAGIPPTIGFVAKFFLFGAAVQAGYTWLAVIGMLTSAVSAYYYLRIIAIMYMREGTPEFSLSTLTRVAIGVAAVATVVLGLLPTPLMDWAARSVFALAR